MFSVNVGNTDRTKPIPLNQTQDKKKVTVALTVKPPTIKPPLTVEKDEHLTGNKKVTEDKSQKSGQTDRKLTVMELQRKFTDRKPSLNKTPIRKTTASKRKAETVGKDDSKRMTVGSFIAGMSDSIRRNEERASLTGFNLKNKILTSDISSKSEQGGHSQEGIQAPGRLTDSLWDGLGSKGIATSDLQNLNTQSVHTVRRVKVQLRDGQNSVTSENTAVTITQPATADSCTVGKTGSGECDKASR